MQISKETSRERAFARDLRPQTARIVSVPADSVVNATTADSGGTEELVVIRYRRTADRVPVIIGGMIGLPLLIIFGMAAAYVQFAR